MDDSKPVIALLETIQLDAIQPSYASHVELKKWSGVQGELFDTLYAFQQQVDAPQTEVEAYVPQVEDARGSTSYALEVGVSVADNTMLVNASRDVSRLSLTQLRLILDEFQFSLGQVCDAVFSNGIVGDLWGLSPSQHQMLRESCFGPQVPLAHELLHQAFECRAVIKPDLIAVEYEGQRLTYGDLNEQANTLAHHLVSLGVGVGSRVAVVMERCLEFPIGLLAVLKAGGSMMPLDATFPSNRLLFMLGDARAIVVVSTEDYRAHIEALDLAIPVVYIRSTDLAASPTQLDVVNTATRNDEAYVVYTSGSTGRPKGVPVLHVGAVNTFLNSNSELFAEGMRCAQMMAISFDGCQFEVWSALTHGATLILRGSDLLETLANVNSIVCTPTALSLLGDPHLYPSLKYVAVAGEALSYPLKNLWASHVHLINKYGPSECAIETHECLLGTNDSISIGPVIPNVNCYVLDDNMRQVPVGVVGEIYLGGICVSPGYINLPEQTAERFLDDPFVPGGGRMFRTGDYGRLLPNGRFEMHGRKDSQVKLKGYRIELEEVGEAMMRHPHVTAAAAVVKDKTHLVGYFTPPSVDVEELRALVASYVPVYMVPAVWVPLESMPQNVNGKTDRLALEAMDVVVVADALETEEEVKMAEVWSSVLGIELSLIGRNTSFFALGGDSLSVIKVVAACRKLGLVMSATQFLKDPVLSRVAAMFGSEVVMDWPAVVLPEAIVNEIADVWTESLDLQEYVVYPVTPLQAGMLFSTLSKRSAYVMQYSLLLGDDLTAEMASEGYRRVARQHEILRTTFVSLTSGLVQIIRSDIAEPSVEHVSVHHLEDFFKTDYARGFALGDRSFVRFTIVSAGSEEYAVLTIHHALYDGWSFSLLVDDLLDAFHGRPISSRPSFRGFVDYIQAQDANKTQVYWESELRDVVSSIIAPGSKMFTEEDFSSIIAPGSKMFAEEDSRPSVLVEFPGEEISLAAKHAQVTFATLTKFAWAATIRKFLRQQDTVMGEVVSNRNLPVDGIERMLGATLSTIPRRIIFDDEKSVLSQLQAVHTNHTASQVFAHANLVDVKKWSGVQGELFDTLYVFQQSDVSQMADKAYVSHIEEARASTTYALEMEVSVADNTMLVNASRDVSRLSLTQLRLILDEFQFSLGQVCDAVFSDGIVGDLWGLSPSQHQMLRESCFGPQVPLAHELLHQAFECRAVTKPDLIAVEYEGQRLTYGDLNEQANTLAHHLVSLGVGVGSRVAVVMERCLEFPIGLLAVLKAGGSMMPLDATFPSNRLLFMLGDARAIVVVSTEDYRAHIEALDLAIPVVYIRSTDLAASPTQLDVVNTATRNDEAYVVYTSGSTGRPKGVPVLHVGAVNTFLNSNSELFAEGMRCAQMMAISFDGCQFEVWSALTHGATLILRGSDLLETLANVNSIVCTPTALSLLGDPHLYPSLKYVAVAGEALSYPLKNLWASHVHLINKYGPSECAIETHECLLGTNDSISIGPVIPNVNCYVLDDNMRQVPVGVVGEIYLGGICVSPGYINLPEQTAERFLDDPFVPGGGRMFRTGDYGRLLPNGRFEMHGRKDSQVKLKGYRIELEEVGEAMMRHPHVTAAAAVVKDKTHLVGYFTPLSVDVEELRALVASYVPVYMVPAVWVPLESMPQNVNGKTDRLALEAMDVVVVADALETEEEVKMAEVWSSVLGIELSLIGRNTSFFALGGDSLSVIKVVAACRKLGLVMSATQFLKDPVLSRVAAMFGSEVVMDWPAVVLPEAIVNEIADVWTESLDLQEYVVYPVTPLQAGMLFSTLSKRSAYVMQYSLLLGDDLTAEMASEGYRRVARQHEILRTTFVSLTSGLVQIIRSDIAEPSVEHVSVHHLEDFFKTDYARGFALGDRSFVRFTIVSAGSEEYAVLTIHHALYDGWSFSLLVDDLLDAFHGRPISSRPSFRGFVDYIQAQDANKTQANWKSTLDKIVPTKIGSIGSKIIDDDQGLESLEFALPIKSVSLAAKRARVTLAILTKFAWAMTLAKHLRQRDIVLIEIVSNRNAPVKGIERMLGAALSMIPCRIIIDDTVPVSSLLHKVQADHIASLAYSHASLEDMKMPTTENDNSLFDTSFIF
ncbi:hypothetical protein AC1031_014685 [Aphanomyces cochlioides]|nr:hypothetical protein AC1031_014685 [Aphanomyces cochlioides]